MSVSVFHHISRMKGKNHMIISIDTGKVLDINPTSFYDKIITKLITKQSRQGNIGIRIDILINEIE